MKPPGTKVKKGEALFAEMTPVAHEGVLYMPDGKGNPWAIDGGTGERICDARIPQRARRPGGVRPAQPGCGDRRRKGHLASPDASITAYNQATGRQV